MGGPYDIRITFKSCLTLPKHLFWSKPQTEYYMTKNCGYSIPCCYGKVYIGKTCCPLKVKPQEHWKAVVHGKIEKLGMADHIYEKKKETIYTCGIKLK